MAGGYYLSPSYKWFYLFYVMLLARFIGIEQAGEDLLLPVAQEFVVTPLVAGAVPHVSVSPYLRGTFTDSIGLSLCGGIEVDVLKASAGIVGLGEWSIGPLYAAEAELGLECVAFSGDDGVDL